MTEVEHIAKVLCRGSADGRRAKDVLAEVIVGFPNAQRSAIAEALDASLAQLDPDLALDLFVMVAEIEDEGDEPSAA
jgi:hypothetical protein